MIRKVYVLRAGLFPRDDSINFNVASREKEDTILFGFVGGSVIKTIQLYIIIRQKRHTRKDDGKKEVC